MVWRNPFDEGCDWEPNIIAEIESNEPDGTNQEKIPLSTEGKDWLLDLQVWDTQATPVLNGTAYVNRERLSLTGAHRIRKVKCDEAKPFCNRCTSTGRKCDGYDPVPKKRSRTHSILPRPSGPSRSLATHTDLFASQAEGRSFEFFQAQVCLQLGAPFHMDFWSQNVLQAAIYYPSIRHLVVALGAAYEVFEARNSEELSPSQNAEKVRFTLQQSNESIRHLSEIFRLGSVNKKSREATGCILTVSILLAHISFLQGSRNQATEHVRSGLKVLSDFESTEKDLNQAQTYPIHIAELRSLLVSLYGQVRCMMIDEALVKWERDPLVSEIKPASSFSSISQAHDYIEKLFHNMLAFLQYTELYPPATSIEIDTAKTRHQQLQNGLESSRKALEMFASRSWIELDDHSKRGINTLRLHQTLLGIRLQTNYLQPRLRESSFDKVENQLKQMVEYCELLAMDDQEGSKRPSSSSGLGIIMPLHTVAARCRNPEIRRRALVLLQKCARREGIWDSERTSKVVAKTIEIEESSGPGKVSDNARVRQVRVIFEGDGKLVLEYITVANWKAKQKGTQYSLT